MGAVGRVRHGAREFSGCRAAASDSGPATSPIPSPIRTRCRARARPRAPWRASWPAAGPRPPTAALPQALSPALYGRAAVRALGRVRHGARAGRLQGCGLQQRRLVLLCEAVAGGVARAVLGVAARLCGTGASDWARTAITAGYQRGLLPSQQTHVLSTLVSMT